ncbi:MAG: hypothetical protein HRU38_24895 [Saccharospirillaceae bacterium]|nr:hypothetical protein [Saccharospirillaceae bacterium]
MEDDKFVSSVINNFIFSISCPPRLSNMPIGKERSNLLQDGEITTPAGQQYDYPIGHSDELLSPDMPPENIF